PSLVAELERAARTYHEDPSILDRLRTRLEQASADDPTAEHLTALARVLYNWAEIRATTADEKIDAFERGRAAAARALRAQDTTASAHFWYAVNSARWGEMRGMAGSLSVLGEVRREARRVLELDPKFAPGYTLAGSIA